MIASQICTNSSFWILRYVFRAPSWIKSNKQQHQRGRFIGSLVHTHTYTHIYINMLHTYIETTTYIQFQSAHKLDVKKTDNKNNIVQYKSGIKNYIERSGKTLASSCFDRSWLVYLFFVVLFLIGACFCPHANKYKSL